MSVDHSANVIVGYVIPVQCFFKPLLKFVPEKWHMEKRYDPITGKEIAPVRIVDRQEGYAISIRGEWYEGPTVDDDLESFSPEDDVREAISEALDCKVVIDGDFYDGPLFVCLSSAKMRAVNAETVSIDQIVKVQKDLERIGKACKRILKVNPGVCGVHTVLSVT